MKGLKRLILINTHIKGRVAEIRLDGHANLSGGNGSGKTSLLKLIPFFYGTEPSKLCPRVENKKSFVDYFLPSDKSYLVYEYLTGMGMACVVVYRHSSGLKPAYRFMPGSFQPEAFYSISSDGKSNAYSNAEIKKKCTSLSIEVSRQIESVQDYRAILMNQRSELDRREDSIELKRLIPLYSLSPRHPLFHLEKISEAALSSEGSLDRIKKIVAKIMEEDGVAVTKVKLDKESESLGEEITALREIDKETPKLLQTVSDALALTETRKTIGRCHGELKYWEVSLNTSLEAKRVELDKERQGGMHREEEWISERTNYVSCISKLTLSIEAGDEVIKSITDERTKYEDDEIYDKKAKMERIGEVESLTEQAEKRIQDLQGKDRDAQNQFLRDKSDLADRDKAQRKELDQQNELINHKDSALTERESNKQREIRKRFGEKREDIGQRFRSEEVVLTVSLTAAKEQAGQTFLMDAEALQLAAAESFLEDRQRVHSDELLVRGRADQSLKSRTGDLEKAQKGRRESEKTLENENKRLVEIASWINPEVGTLREVMIRQEHPWTQTVAKIILPELLDRKDLKPEWMGDDRSLYGWALNLDSIDVPPYGSSIDDIKRQYDEQKNTVDVAEQRLVSANELMNKAEDDLRIAQKAWHEQDRRVSVAKSQVDSALTALKNEKSNVADAQERRRTSARKEAARLEASISELKRREEGERQRLSNDEKEALREVAGIYAIERDEIRHEREAITVRREQQDNHYKEKLKQLESDKQERLSKCGISAGTIEQAEAEYSRYSQQLKTYRGYREEVYRFDDFIKTTWSGLESRLAKCEKEKEERRGAESKLSSAEARYRESCEVRRNLEIGLLRETKAINEQISTIDSLLSRLRNEIATQPEEVPSRSIDLLVSDINEALILRGQQEDSVLSGVRSAENILTRRQRSPLYDAWAQSCREMESSGSVIDQSMQKATALDRMLQSGVRQVRETLLQRVKITSQGLAAIFENMERVQGSVARESNRISKSIKEIATADALQNIELKFISRIEKLDYWPQLKRFYGLWKEWEKIDDTLPPPDFEDSLGAITKEYLLSKKELSIDSLFEIQLKVTENGNDVVITTDRGMNAVSSTGLSLMFIFTIYAGITRLYCKKTDIAIHWPVDELARLDPINAGRLVALMDSCGVIMVGGFPSTDESLTRIFVNKHIVDPEKGIVHFKLSENPIEMAIKNRELALKVGV